jgi:hypothetical protein
MSEWRMHVIVVLSSVRQINSINLVKIQDIQCLTKYRNEKLKHLRNEINYIMKIYFTVNL